MPRSLTSAVLNKASSTVAIQRTPGLSEVVVMWDDGPSNSLSALQHGLQQALADSGIAVVHRQQRPLTRQLARGLGKLKLIRPIFSSAGRSITVLSWASDTRAFPDSYWRQLVPWIFDCWQPQFPQWEALLIRHRIRMAFFSARDAAEYFAGRIPGLNAIWVPEACDPAAFCPDKPLRERSIQVLEVGRRWDVIHRAIREPLCRAGIRHLYNPGGQHNQLFKDTQALHAAFADTAIMLCFPKSLTHPMEAGCVETMTQRYLEAIGSGCLPVGHAPPELIDLFGFNPVIELSMSDPAGHLLEIIATLSTYQAVAESSLLQLKQAGTFSERAGRIVAALDQ